MASPTEGEIQTQIAAVVDLLEDTKTFGDSFLTLENTIVTSMEGDFAVGVLNGLEGYRGRLSGMLSSGVAAAMLEPLFLSYAKVIAIPDRDIPGIFKELTDNFIAGAKAVASRVYVFGAPSAGGSNIGDGLVNRLTTDKDADDIENATAEVKKVKCIQDEHSGAVEHEEVFLISGATPGKDSIEVTGSGASLNLVALSARHSARLIRNPSFEDITGAVGSLTAIAGWTVASDIANLDADETDVYRGFAGATTPRSIKFETNETITQNLNVSAAQFDPLVPVYVQVAWMRKASADGNLTLTLGSQSVVVDVTTGTNDLWNILQLPLDENLWFPNWNEEDPTVALAIDSNTTGDIIVDDLIVSPMTWFDGTWWAVVGGQTPFLRDDVFTITDSETGSKLQTWFWRAFGLYLPHGTGGAITWADP